MSDQLNDLADAHHPLASTTIRRPRLIPTYSGIVFGAFVLQAVAVLLALGGLVAVLKINLPPVWTVEVEGDAPSFNADVIFAVIVGMIPAVGLLSAAALVSMVAQVARAVRDIARNSFRT